MEEEVEQNRVNIGEKVAELERNWVF